MEIVGTDCCAVDEISGITGKTPDSVLRKVCQNYFEDEDKCAFYLFTDIDKNDYKNAIALKKFIETNKLGRVTVSRAKKNPNSGNMVKIYVWEISQRVLKVFNKKHYGYSNDDDRWD